MSHPANPRPGVIPAGRTAIGDADVAALLGVSLDTFRRRKLWATLPPTLSRDGARVRLWDLDQVRAHLAGEPVPTLSTEEQPLDLLDVESALAALPADRQPTEETWRSYLSIGTGPAVDQLLGAKTQPATPAPAKAGAGAPYRYRRTVLAWDAERPEPGGAPGRGRPKGAGDKKPRNLEGVLAHQVAEQRRTRTRDLLRQAAAAGVDLLPEQLAIELEVTPRHAARLLDQARENGD
jgi:hypothetical protein